MVEEKMLDEIKNKVFESNLKLRASEQAGKDEHVASAREHLEVLTEADDYLKSWSNDLDEKAEQMKGYGNSTAPNRDDPYFKLHAQNVPYILELRREKEKLEAWLASQVN